MSNFNLLQLVKKGLLSMHDNQLSTSYYITQVESFEKKNVEKTITNLSGK